MHIDIGACCGNRGSIRSKDGEGTQGQASLGSVFSCVVFRCFTSRRRSYVCRRCACRILDPDPPVRVTSTLLVLILYYCHTTTIIGTAHNLQEYTAAATLAVANFYTLEAYSRGLLVLTMIPRQCRREKYTKKFFRKKKIYDIIKDRGRKAVREATWATRSAPFYYRIGKALFNPVRLKEGIFAYMRMRCHLAAPLSVCRAQGWVHVRNNCGGDSLDTCTRLCVIDAVWCHVDFCWKRNVADGVSTSV